MFSKALSVALFLFISTTTYSATTTSVEIKDGGKKLISTLQAMPSAKMGKGPALYIFEFTDCPYCQAFYKDFQGFVPGIKTHHFFYAVSEKTANETAALALMPRSNIYHMFMRQSRQAAPYNKNQKRLDAYNAIMGPLNDVILPTLIKNGWKAQSLVSPTFIWEENGRVFADGGYRRDHFETLIASIRKTDPATAEKVTKNIPDHAKSTHRHEGAPLKTTEVQGIKLGMPFKEAEKLALEKGYLKAHLYYALEDNQSYKKLWIGGGNYTKAGKSEATFVASIKYEQTYKPEIQFPTEALQNAVLTKYGQPLNEVKADKNYGSYAFSYYPPNPDRNIVQNNCTNEMNIKGSEPYKEGPIVLHPMTFKVWQERGMREVKARCPDQLADFEKLMDFELGIWGAISINPYTKTFMIDIKNHGPKQYQWRWLKEEKLLQQDFGPIGTVDL